jgi:hypothetical protein
VEDPGAIPATPKSDAGFFERLTKRRRSVKRKKKPRGVEIVFFRVIHDPDVVNLPRASIGENAIDASDLEILIPSAIDAHDESCVSPSHLRGGA